MSSNTALFSNLRKLVEAFVLLSSDEVLDDLPLPARDLDSPKSSVHVNEGMLYGLESAPHQHSEEAEELFECPNFEANIVSQSVQVAADVLTDYL
jgi:hypothetical protein